MQNKTKRLALRVSLIYCFVAGVWILLSDRVLIALVSDLEVIGKIAMFKGWAFVAVTALLLYFTLRNQLRHWEQEANARMLAEEKVRKLSQAVEQSPVSVVITDTTGKIEYVNRKFTEVTGYSFEEALGKSPRILKSGELSAETYKQLWACITGGGTWSGEFHNRKKNGELYWEWATLSPVLDATGKPTHFLAVKEDITQRKRVEESLRASEERLNEAQRLARIGSWTWQPDGNLIWSETMFKLFGVPRDVAPTFEHFLVTVHPDDRKRVNDGFRAWVASDRIHNEEEYRLLLPDGSTRTIVAVGNLERDPNGQAVCATGTCQDITENRKLEEQFRQSQKMEAIGHLAGGVTHDFNNILAVIQMQAGLLEAAGSLLPTQRDYCKEIGKAVQRAANLTRQLLLFSRRQALQPHDLNLNDVIINITKMLQRILGEDVRLQFNYSPAPLLIHADAGMMDQILMNLAVNSRDAMPKGGRLIIETSAVEFDEVTAAQAVHARPGRYACLSVSDSGGGIPSENLPRIFEPFFTTKGVGKGTGLGLATVFGIVQQHQGWINVYSEVGHGTTFRVYLPRLAQTAGQPSATARLAGVRGGNETILLVEDESSLCALVQRVLTRLGYRVLEAPTSFTALEVWKHSRNDIHLLLTDLILPDGMNGKELAKQLLQDNPKLKVIYTSGYSADIAGKNFPLLEGVNFLSKPFEAHKLAQIVREKLDA